MSFGNSQTVSNYLFKLSLQEFGRSRVDYAIVTVIFFSSSHLLLPAYLLLLRIFLPYLKKIYLG